MKQYIADAFTDEIFKGNQAAVCVMDKWPFEDTMMHITMENNFSETAFMVKEENGHYRLRWFTPGGEIDLCGHATLASGYILFRFYEKDKEEVVFDTMSGPLTVARKEDLYVMDFPAYELKQVPVTDEMEEAIGVRPLEAWMGRDLLCVLPTEEDVRNAEVDQEKVKNWTAFSCTLRQEGRNGTLYPEALLPSSWYRKTRCAEADTAISCPTGRKNWAKRKSLPIRLPGGSASCIAGWKEIGFALAAGRRCIRLRKLQIQ